MLRSANTHSRVHSRASQMAILWCLQKPLWDVLKVIYMPLCAINFQRLHACIYAFFIPLMCLSVQGYTTLVSLSLLLSLVKIFLKSDLNFWQQAWCGLFSLFLFFFQSRSFCSNSCENTILVRHIQIRFSKKATKFDEILIWCLRFVAFSKNLNCNSNTLTSWNFVKHLIWDMKYSKVWTFKWEFRKILNPWLL